MSDPDASERAEASARKAEKKRRKRLRRWRLAGVITLTHLLVFALGVLGDGYVFRLYGHVVHPLVVIDRAWPNFECYPAEIAIPPGGPAPASFGAWPSSYQDPIAAAGAAFVDGELSLRLVTRDTQKAYIYGLSLKVLQQDPNASPDWVGRLRAGGCGDVKIRKFDAALKGAADSVNLVDRGLVGDGDPEKDAPSSQLGADFTVSNDDPAHIHVDVHACAGLYRFALQITYGYLGDTYVDTVGTYTVMGSDRAVPYYTYDQSVEPQREGTTRAGSTCAATTPPTESTPTVAPVTAFPPDYTGTWTGQLYEDSNRTWKMTVRIGADSTVATVDYPELGCSGTWTLVPGPTVQARERITHLSQHACTRTGRMSLSMTVNGSMLISYVPDGASYTATGVLTRE